MKHPVSSREQASTANNLVPAQNRIVYMDNLRAFALLIGVLFHASLAYSPILSNVWPTADKQNSEVIDILALFSHHFRMPLFFAIAGFFAHLLVKKRGWNGFIVNRLKRLALPFIIFFPLLTVSVIAILIYSAFHLPVNTPILHIIKESIENPATNTEEQPPLSTMHLWFLYYLTMLCLITFCFKYVSHLIPLAFKNLKLNLWLALLVMPLLASLFLIGQLIPLPAPEHLQPKLWALCFYGLFFYFGWLLYKNEEFVYRLAKVNRLLIAVALMAHGIFMAYLPEKLSFEQALLLQKTGPNYTFEYVVSTFTSGFIACYMVLLSLVIFKRFANKQSRAMRYFSDSSYWLYLIHIPIVFFLQAYFNQVSWGAGLKTLCIFFITVFIGSITYSLLVKPTPINWLFKGKAP